MLIYTESILDLRQHGVLALTLGSMAYAPLPAHLHGHARWHGSDGAVVDCAELCFRAVPASDMHATIERVRARLAGAVASVRGYHDWAAGQVADPWLDAPTAAAALGRGRALLVFGSEHRPHLLRLVDVAAQRIVWEETVEALRQRLRVKAPAFGASVLDHVLIDDAATDHVLLGLGSGPLLMRVGEGGLERIDVPHKLPWLEGGFTASHFVVRDRDNLALTWLALDGSVAASAQPRGRKNVEYFVPLATAVDGERIALSYEGGLVELIDGPAGTSTLLRPLPQAAGKDIVGIAFSPSGRYMLASAGADGVARLFDWQTQRAADVRLPVADVAGQDRSRFEPELRYRPAWAVTDRGGFVLEHANLTHTAPDRLAWTAFSPTAPGSAPSVQAAAALAQRVAAWTRRAVALKPAKKGSGASHLYGAAALGGTWSWPEHEGVPMWLLCELDLAQVHSLAPDIGLPAHGALLFFVAVDAQGEPAMRPESFDPARVCVLHAPDATGAAAAARDNPWSVAAQLLQLRIDPCSDWPQADAALVRAGELPDDQLSAYHDQLERHAPDGAAAGHRLGGWPHLLQSNFLEVQADAIARGLPLDSTELTWESAARWRLLLQLDSDDVYMWGTDSGMLYFMILDEDLARGDFSRIVALTAGC